MTKISVIKTKKLLSWEEIKPLAEDLFDNYDFEIYWAQAAWDLLLENINKIGGIKSNNKMVESVLYLFALYDLYFRFKWANGLEYADTGHDLDLRIEEFDMEKELSKYFFGDDTHKTNEGKEFMKKLFDDCTKRTERYEKFIKEYFNNDVMKINCFFAGYYYIDHYTDYDKKRGENDEEYDAEYDKYRCEVEQKWIFTSFLDGF
jgi:hypothetical protein